METKVLYIEHNILDYEYLKESLKNNAPHIKLFHTPLSKQGIELLTKEKYDLLLVDLTMPDMNAIDVIKNCKSNNIDIPIIVITGFGKEEDAVEALKAGAYDYVTKKDNYALRLPQTIENAIKTHQQELLNKKLIEELKAKNEELNKLLNEEIRLKKLLRKKLNLSDERFKILTNTSPSSVFIYKGEHFIYTNDKCSELTEYSREELLKIKFWDLVHPEEKELVKQRGLARLKGESIPQSYEFRIVTKSGKVKWIHFTAGFLHEFEEGAVIATATDITELKNTINELNESKERYKSLIEGINEVIYRIKPEANPEEVKIDFVSPQVFNITGLSSDELMKRPISWFEAVIDEDKEIIKNFYNEFYNNKKTVSYCYRIKNYSTNTIHWIEDKLMPKLDEQGNLIEGLGIIRDITEKISYEEERNKLIQAIEQSSTIIIMTDLEGKIIFANKKLFTTTGYNKDEILGSNFIQLIKIKSDTDICDYWKKLPDIKNWEGELKCLKKNGDFFWSYIVISPVYNTKNQIVNFIIVIDDITERKKILEDLILAKNKAEEADKLKSNFLAQISHEIRTPLNAIMSYTELIRDEVCSEKKEEYSDIFDGIANAGSRIIRTIDMILNASELQAGAYEMIIKPVDLFNDVILKAYKEVKLKADSKKLDLRVKKLTDHTTVNCDEYSVYQTLINLVDNAIKYTKTGFVEIRLLRAQKNNLQIEVEDSGIGINESFLQNIFEPFTQEESGYTRRFDGTGLGLSLVKKYCELNNIEINVKSKKNVGTTFTLTFLNS